MDELRHESRCAGLLFSVIRFLRALPVNRSCAQKGSSTFPAKRVLLPLLSFLLWIYVGNKIDSETGALRARHPRLAVRPFAAAHVEEPAEQIAVGSYLIPLTFPFARLAASDPIRSPKLVAPQDVAPPAIACRRVRVWRG